MFCNVNKALEVVFSINQSQKAHFLWLDCVLMFSCPNIALLLLARSSFRQKGKFDASHLSETEIGCSISPMLQYPAIPGWLFASFKACNYVSHCEHTNNSICCGNGKELQMLLIYPLSINFFLCMFFGSTLKITTTCQHWLKKVVILLGYNMDWNLTRHLFNIGIIIVH